VDPEAVSVRAYLVIALAVSALGCDKIFDKDPPPPSEPPPPPVDTASALVPPVIQNAVPVQAFADASLDVDGETPYQQARAYETNGQLWVARLILEKKALSPDGTREEAELLATICARQGDEGCVIDCEAKLGRKLPRTITDAADAAAQPVAPPAPEPDSELSRARELYRKKKLDAARAILEPRVLAAAPAPDEVELLKTICQTQRDRICVALCDSKLK
jgi:hypothetical protein